MVDIPENAQDVILLNDNIAFYTTFEDQFYKLWINDGGVIDEIEAMMPHISITDWIQLVCDRVSENINQYDRELQELYELKNRRIYEHGILLDALYEGKRYNVGAL